VNSSDEEDTFSSNIARMTTEKRFLTVYYHLEEIKNFSRSEYKKVRKYNS
jgi:hypothetical protein